MAIFFPSYLMAIRMGFGSLGHSGPSLFQVPKMDIDEAFEAKDELSSSISAELLVWADDFATEMMSFGYIYTDLYIIST